MSSPLAPYFKLLTDMSLKTVDEHEYMSHVPYASAVGRLMYAMECTRPKFVGPMTFHSSFDDDQHSCSYVY